MKKIISMIVAISVMATTFGGCNIRQDKYENSLRVGTTALPKNLNPYSSMESSATFFVSLFYNTLLGSISAPVDYVEGEPYIFPDGSVYTPVDRDMNPLAFANVCAYEPLFPFIIMFGLESSKASEDMLSTDGRIIIFPKESQHEKVSSSIAFTFELI